MGFTADVAMPLWLFARVDVFVVYLLCLIPLAIEYASREAIAADADPRESGAATGRHSPGPQRSARSRPAANTRRRIDVPSSPPSDRASRAGLRSWLRWLSIAYTVGLSGWLLGSFAPLAPPLSFATASGPLGDHLVRLLLILPCTAALAAVSAWGLRLAGNRSLQLAPPVWRFGGILLSLGVPLAYVDSVAEGLQNKLEAALDDQRITVARQQAARLIQLRPLAKLNEVPLARLVNDLDASHRRLVAAAASPLPPDAPTPVIGQRIGELIRLERCDEAIDWLRPLTEGPTPNPTAWDYLGLCYQRLELPSLSLDAYRRAEELWRDAPIGRARTDGLANAYRGIAFAARQLDRRELEATSYRAMVEVKETAENHFLLAQCYREHQQTDRAATHFRRALTLAPEMAAEIETILATMRTDHFGCLRVGG